MSFLRRYLPLLTLTVAVIALYFYRLNGFGVIPPDEPRYAAIGQSMAQTGDWITPKLWGSPWFEKPSLLYWMTAIGTEAGLGPGLSGRFPVALLSIGFLIAAFFLLRREFGSQAAFISMTLLATSAGWLTYSQLCLTDLPMSAFFSLAVLLGLPFLRRAIDEREAQWRFVAMGACLGAGMLAKGLVPIALAAPFLWFFRQWWRKWWLAVAACVLVAGPWYGAVYAINGFPFVEEFFVRHHLERLYSTSLQHVQPWYYYAPVLLAGLFPWTPFLGLLFRPKNQWDGCRAFLASIVAFGFLLFSASLNKLPGYLLPLFPSIFVLIGVQFEKQPLLQLRRVWLVCCACLIALIPFVAKVLPQALAAGRLSWPTLNFGMKGVTPTECFYVALPLAIVAMARRSWTPVLLVLSLVAGAFYLKDKSDPILNNAVSARGLWHKIQPIANNMCEDGVGRDWRYGLQFYRGAKFPACGDNGHFAYALHPNGHNPPIVKRLHK